MGKIGGLALVSVLALTGCTTPLPTEHVVNIQPATDAQGAMLDKLRPLMKTLRVSDAAIVSEARGACVSLLFRSRDSYREGALTQYKDVTLALDHLLIAAAAHYYICP